MTKTLTLATVITSMWQSPLIALLILISLVFLVDLYRQYAESKKITCSPPDLSTWNYRSLQSYAKANNIRANQKRSKLIALLQEV